MELKHNKWDVFVYLVSFLIVVCLFVVSGIVTSKINGDVRYAVVVIEGKQKFKLNMREDTTIFLSKEKYSNLLGDMVIEIQNEKVRVEREESPFHYCSLQGWVEDVGRPIVCLPNDVIVTIVGEGVPMNDVEVG